jgi:regulator of sigma E protease
MQVKNAGSAAAHPAIIQTHLLDLSYWHLDSLSPDLLHSIGIVPYEPPLPLILGYILKDSPAAASTLQTGDKIIAINKTPLQDWPTLVTFISKHPDQTVHFTIERQHKTLEIPVAIGYQHNWLWQKTGFLGIGPQMNWPPEFLQKVQYGPIAAAAHAWQTIVDFTEVNFILFGKLITGKVSLNSLGGPITIFESAGTALNSGFLPFLGFLAFLSIAVGVINVLPIPGLDGGHLLIQVIELIRGKPLPVNALLWFYRIGFTLIFFVFLQAFMNDILRML